MPKILIATQNKGKLNEIRALMDDMKLAVITPEQINLKIDIKEDGKTYKENASKKAKAYAESTGFLTLADDSGLEVEALNGAPGIYSARFSKKPDATDADRRAYLLARLRPYPQPWVAQFKCVVALEDPKKDTYFAEGVCPGRIIQEERGSFGFGYDPIFMVNGGEKTMAELTMQEKNLKSHRARAVQAIKPILIQVLKTGND